MARLLSRPWHIFAQVILTLLAIVYAAPLVVMFSISLQGEGFGNYVAVLSHPMIPRFFLNSSIVTLCTIILVYIVTLLAGYAFSKLKLYGKNVLFNIVLIGLMVPSISLIVPLFIVFRELDLFNNYLALILPYTAFSVPFTLLLMRNFLDSVPDELIDAARLDGCNSFTAMIWIVMPLSRSISIVVVIWTFLSAWNEYFLALVFMRNQQMQTITQAPQFFNGFYEIDTGKIFAALVIISIPVMLVYLTLQRYVEEGMVSGALK